MLEHKQAKAKADKVIQSCTQLQQSTWTQAKDMQLPKPSRIQFLMPGGKSGVASVADAKQVYVLYTVRKALKSKIIPSKLSFWNRI